MNFIIYYLISLFIVNGFILKPTNRNNCYLKMSSDDDFKFEVNLWEQTSSFMKDRARRWFIDRAEKQGIKWNQYLEKFDSNTELKLEKIKEDIENTCIIYPDYFLKPFHGYDNGNMNWEAAKEGEGATISMSVNYWQGVSPEDSENWLRTNYTNTIKEYLNYKEPNTILDIGSSFGLGTNFVKEAFPNSLIKGLDLSPYFVAVAKYLTELNESDISFIHANAEEIPLPDNSLDLITVQYLFHEVPTNPTKQILSEIYRVLKPGGSIAIIDLDPKRVLKGLESNFFRKWAFEVTEPHIAEYYRSDMINIMQKEGFKEIKNEINDPLNCVWLGKKII